MDESWIGDYACYCSCQVAHRAIRASSHLPKRSALVTLSSKSSSRKSHVYTSIFAKLNGRGSYGVLRVCYGGGGYTSALNTIISVAENQKGVNNVQQYSVENQKGAIAIGFVQRQCPSGTQRNILADDSDRGGYPARTSLVVYYCCFWILYETLELHSWVWNPNIINDWHHACTERHNNMISIGAWKLTNKSPSNNSPFPPTRKRFLCSAVEK